MTIFAKPPLVELIVELKWGDAAPLQSPQSGQVIQGFFQVDSAKQEEFFMRFGGECYSRGLQISERLVPPGFPQLPGQVVCRFKNGRDGNPNLLQVGQGVFTANALPPYGGWDEFRPFLATGISCLTAAREASDASKPFTSVAIRYINAFGSEYLQQYSQADLLRMLNFKFQLPSVISESIKEDESTSVVLNYSSTLNDSGRLSVIVGSGQTRNETAVLFDIGVAYSNVSLEDASTVIEQGHAVLERIFMSATEPLHSMMRAQEG